MVICLQVNSLATVLLINSSVPTITASTTNFAVMDLTTVEMILMKKIAFNHHVILEPVHRSVLKRSKETFLAIVLQVS
jgi:hypothetical protein